MGRDPQGSQRSTCCEALQCVLPALSDDLSEEQLNDVFGICQPIMAEAPCVAENGTCGFGVLCCGVQTHVCLIEGSSGYCSPIPNCITNSFSCGGNLTGSCCEDHTCIPLTLRTGDVTQSLKLPSLPGLCRPTQTSCLPLESTCGGAHEMTCCDDGICVTDQIDHRGPNPMGRCQHKPQNLCSNHLCGGSGSLSCCDGYSCIMPLTPMIPTPPMGHTPPMNPGHMNDEMSGPPPVVGYCRLQSTAPMSPMSPMLPAKSCMVERSHCGGIAALQCCSGLSCQSVQGMVHIPDGTGMCLSNARQGDNSHATCSSEGGQCSNMNEAGHFKTCCTGFVCVRPNDDARSVGRCQTQEESDRVHNGATCNHEGQLCDGKDHLCCHGLKCVVRGTSGACHVN